MSTFSVSGLASGLDWQSIIEQLQEVEYERVTLKEEAQADCEEELEAWQSLDNYLLTLQTSAEKLSDSDNWALFSADLSSDNVDVDADDLLTVTTSEDADAGSYTIEVTNLATAQKLSSNPFTDKSSALGDSYAGDIIINGQVITISSTDTLADVASRINSANSGSDPIGVTASIVAYAENDYRLVLTSDETGEDGISLLNGSATNLTQKFGWKDSLTAVLKNEITSGAQSDGFTSHNVSIQSLLGLNTAEASETTLAIDGTTVSIDLSSQSLADIKDAINTAMATAGKSDQIVASIISETIDGDTYYRLQIEGTQDFTDENNIFNTLGILDNTSASIAATDIEVSGNAMTTDGQSITLDTLLTDIDGYISYTSGDTILMEGTDTEGNAVSYSFDISANSTVQDLLDAVEDQYAAEAGEVIAYVTDEGKIQIEDISASGNLEVVFTDSITNGELEFVDGDAGFEDGESDRQREIVAGEDATLTIDGVTVNQSSNTIKDIIPGVTMVLTNESSDTTITLTLSHDTETIESYISDFVDSYNAVSTYINTQFTYDEDSGETGGVLFGDTTLKSVKATLAAALSDTIWGVDDDFASLSLLGIETEQDDDGAWTLTVGDELSEYLASNFDDVAALFVAQGSSSGSNLSYISDSDDVQKGTYDVQIYRPATQASADGSIDLSAGGAEETLVITQGTNSATIDIDSDMDIDDIVNAVNAELETEQPQIIVGDESLQTGGTAASATTAWDELDGVSLEDGDIITFSGSDDNGSAISGTYTIDSVSTDSINGLLSAIEDAFDSDVSANIDSSGRITISSSSSRTSQLSLEISTPTGSDLDFGTIDVTDGADDGSQTGRYAMSITASADSNGNLILTADAYGNEEFSISQDTSDDNYNQILYADQSNTTETSFGTAYMEETTTWNDIYDADVTDGDTITIEGLGHDGSSVSATYNISDTSTDTVQDLLDAIETAYSDAGSTVSAFVSDGCIYVEDLTAGTSSMTCTLSANNEGGGSLSLGNIDQTTERDLDLGLINGTVSGQDVAGTIGGESAEGSGQYLTGEDDNTNTAGLTVRYTGSEAVEDAGSVTITIGVAEKFNRLIDEMIDSIDGYLTFKEESLSDQIDNYDDQIEAMEEQIAQEMETLTNKFIAMELTLSELQSQSDWLTSEINAL